MQFTGFLFRHILQKHLVIVYFFSNMSAKNYYHRFLYVEVTASGRSDVLGHNVHVLIAARVKCVHISVICISTLSIYQLFDYACPVKCIMQGVSEKMTLWFIVKVSQTISLYTFNLVFL